MNIFAIGVGGAGNKAIINAIREGVVTKQNSLLINTTLSDIEEDFYDIAMKFGDARGGCGKERPKAKSYMIEGLQSELKHLDVVATEEVEMVVIATSTEGGTGSGSTLILAKYINQVLGKPVQIFAFNGFEEDGRGLKNTVEFFQEIDPHLSVQCTSNAAFSVGTSNKLTAERLSNTDFIKRLRVVTGMDKIESDQNIDSTDLFKVSTQSGYTVCDRIELPTKIKNIDQFNKVIKEALDEDEALDTDQSVKRLAVMFNIAESTRDNVDFYLNTFKDKFGQPFEVYTHVQFDGNDEYVSYIASGLNLPLEEVKDVYSRYKTKAEQVNKARDNFLDEASDLKTFQSDDMFDLENQEPTVSKNDFFRNMGKAETKKKSHPNKFTNKEVHND